MVTVELDLLVAFMLEPAGGTRRDQAVPARPDGEVRHRRLVGDARQRRGVAPGVGDLLVELPDIVLPRVARERRTKGDQRLHAIGMVARIFAAEHAAQAPADDDDRPVMAEAVDPLPELFERVGFGAEVEALLPAVD